MEQQNSAQEFIAGLLANSTRKYNFQLDIEALTFSAFEQRKVEALHEASFTAKYIAGLKRVMQTGAGNPEVQNMQVIQSDIMSSFQQLIALLRGIDTGEQFGKKFLEQTEESFTNLNGLIEDLAQVKVYFNLLRRTVEPSPG
jgi:GTP-sensing pleiotropic transcriptional regulator CodY